MNLLDIKRLPDLLTSSDGRKITTSKEWEQIRRPEIVNYFLDEVFGRFPEKPNDLTFEVTDYVPDSLGGNAVRKTVVASFSGPYGSWSFPFWMFVPKRQHPVGALVLICNRSKEENLDITREIKSPFWPVEEIVERGYAAVSFHNESLDTDVDDGFLNGVQRCFTNDRRSDDWAAISAWAWGAMRVMDYLQEDSLIDNNRIAVAGHSRGGKTSLFTGMMDERYKAVFSSCSGCMGSALTRFKDGETVAQINDVFGYWFCDSFKKYNDREFEMPFEQHMLLASIAPRLLYVTSATEDDWADPDAELAAAKLAGDAYALYGIKGLDNKTYPVPDKALHGGNVGYHRRTGEHNLKTFDWNLFMNFVDARW